jgi:hypothetical protein
LIVILSGAAGLVPAAQAAEHHHCQCSLMGKGKQGQCACPICRLNALRAAANDRALPSGRRAAALEALRAEAEQPENGGSPCVSSRCDGPGTFIRSSSTAEPFLLPRLPVLRCVPTVERAGEPVRAPARVASLPEIPPPRSTDV